MIFWNLSTMILLILASIKFFRVLSCPKHRQLSHRKSLCGGNTGKTMEIRVFKIKSKSCIVAMATYMKADWWNSTILKGKFIERKVTKQKLQTPCCFEDMV